MKIHHYPNNDRKLLELLSKNKLFYGCGDSYKSLITSSSTLVNQDEFNNFYGDFKLLSDFYQIWNDLYLESL